jgi:hypothetical protein
MFDECFEFGARPISLQLYFRAHVGEADRLVGKIARSPYARNVEIAFELDLELEHGDTLRHRIGVDANRETRTQRSKRSFRRAPN